MTPDLTSLLQPIIGWIQDRAVADPAFRAQLHAWGRALIDLADAAGGQPPHDPIAEAAPVTEPVAAAAPAGAASVIPTEPPVPASARPVRFVPAPQPVHVRRTFEVADDELPLVEGRCRLKAEASRWAAIRQRRLWDGADYHEAIESNDRELIARARELPDCFLWMIHRDGPTPADLTRFEDLGGCFEATAASVALIRSLLDNPDEAPDTFERALDLAAEAQSALRGAINAVDWETDRDQLRVFHWLKQTAAERQIMIRRHMRRDDSADPIGWSDLLERIEQVDAGLEEARHRRKRHQSLLSKMRYHLKLIHGDPYADHLHDWHKLVEAVDELVGLGVPPSNREIRDILLSDVDAIPESIDLPPNVGLVLREIDRFLSSRMGDTEVADGVEAVASDEVRQAADLLRGRAVVLIGGERRRLAEEALRAAFGLSEVIWLQGRVHDTYTAFEPYIGRDDVALVLLAIRWSSHGFGDVKRFCESYDKPLVRLPAGYSPNQVAHHILDQAGERLAAEAVPAAG